MRTERPPRLWIVIGVVLVVAVLDVGWWFLNELGCAVGEYDDATSESCQEAHWRWALGAAAAVVASGVLTRVLRSWLPLAAGVVVGLAALTIS